MPQSERERQPLHDKRSPLHAFWHLIAVEMNRDTPVRQCERLCIFAFLAYLSG